MSQYEGADRVTGTARLYRRARAAINPAPTVAAWCAARYARATRRWPMTRWVLAGTVLALSACRSAPRPVYEYEPPITITSTDKPVPQPPAGAPEDAPTTTTVPPRVPAWLRAGATR